MSLSRHHHPSGLLSTLTGRLFVRPNEQPHEPCFMILIVDGRWTWVARAELRAVVYELQLAWKFGYR
ncbi:hypothetical protein LINGRAHAP2_LOCUS9659 [Linum grandiflorum]